MKKQSGEVAEVEREQANHDIVSLSQFSSFRTNRSQERIGSQNTFPLDPESYT
jgi:hypothetical protein